MVIGSNGQDGVYLSSLLREKGYEVTGIGRSGPASIDICDFGAVRDIVRGLAPEEIYHLAAFHHSSEEELPSDHELLAKSLAVNTLSLNHFLHAIHQDAPSCRLFYAASSRVFGDPAGSPQNEDTPLNPRCPYGISKTAGIHLCRYYRAEHKIFCCAGILYNHESPLRPATFLSRKVARFAANARKGASEKLTIRSLEARVDWGYAPDYVAAMWSILQLPEAQDFIIASGSLHSVRDLVAAAFETAELRWEDYVTEATGSSYERRGALCGDTRKLRRLTGWAPRTSFQDMIREMVFAELEGPTP